MREIKFRAWIPEVNRMMLAGSLQFWFKVIAESGTDPFESRPKMILMQYTGLKDKNGKEIYEGDIVRVYETERIGGGENDYRHITKGFIEYRSGSFQLIADDDKGNKGLNRSIPNDCGVIGNIYENPEMVQ